MSDLALQDAPGPGMGAGAEADAPGGLDVSADDGEIANRPVDRDRDLLGRKDAPIRKRLAKLFDDVKKGFEDQSERSDRLDEYWRAYNCEWSSDTQFYNGNATIYAPIIHDAVEARATRFANQLFPQGGRPVDAVASDGTSAAEQVAILEHYIRLAHFKTNILKPMLRNGDIEGQFNLYVDWAEYRRQLVSRETHGPVDPMTGAEMPGEPIDDIKEEDVIEGRPVFEVLHDCDVLVLPASADSIEEALQSGGSVTIVRRWSKPKIEKLVETGLIRGDEGREVMETMGKVAQDQRNVEKSLAEHVGINRHGREATVWECWTMLPLDDKGRYSEKGDDRLCRAFFGPGELQLGAKRNPFWNDRCPLLSEPAKKISGVFKGDPSVSRAVSLQYEANDALNEGADAAAYSALPIIARNPEKNPGPMILNLAAIWDCDPHDVQFMQFPDLTPRAISRVQYCMSEILRTLGINPAMMPQQTGRPGVKRNQAEVALEQSVDLLTTAEAVSVIEEGICTPAMGWVVDLDYQFRDNDITIRMFGEMGQVAKMQQVAPLQNRAGFTFLWRGADQARQNAMMMQQGTGFLNVVRGLRQELMAEGMALKLGPFVEGQARNIFGPMLGSKIIIDQREQLTIQPDEENEMLIDGFEVPVHPLDNDIQHIAEHRKEMATGDIHGTVRLHMQAHLQQAKAKAAALVMGAMQRQMAGQGQPEGGGGGAPGQPQQGAAPAGPRLLKGPPGTIAQDQLPRAGAAAPPRRA